MKDIYKEISGKSIDEGFALLDPCEWMREKLKKAEEKKRFNTSYDEIMAYYHEK